MLTFDITAIGVLGALGAALGTDDARQRPEERRILDPVGHGLSAARWVARPELHGGVTARPRRIGTLPRRVQHGIIYYLGRINAHMVPLPAIPDARCALAASRRIVLHACWQPLRWAARGGIPLTVRYFRYVVPVFPVVLCLASLGLASLSSFGRWGKVLTWVTVVALITSTAPFVWSHVALSALARVERAVTVRDRPMDTAFPSPCSSGISRSAPRTHRRDGRVPATTMPNLRCAGRRHTESCR